MSLLPLRLGFVLAVLRAAAHREASDLQFALSEHRAEFQGRANDDEHRGGHGGEHHGSGGGTGGEHHGSGGGTGHHGSGGGTGSPKAVEAAGGITDATVILVSNRVPIPKKVGGPLPPGGLTSGITDSMKDQHVVWIGTRDNEKAAEESGTPLDRQLEEHHVAALPNLKLWTFLLTQQEHENFYELYSNQFLWPFFHNLVDRIDYATDQMPDVAAIYEAVNTLFSQVIARVIPIPASFAGRIWVHDYHLIPLGRLLKAIFPHAKVGFFLHIPFPTIASWNFVKTSGSIGPGAESTVKLLQDLSEYDLVGLQTNWDHTAFQKVVGHEVAAGTISNEIAGPFISRVGVFPIGISGDEFREVAGGHTEQGSAWLKDLVGDKKVFFGVERADYTKGVTRRLMGYETLLREHPEIAMEWAFVQISPQTRKGVDMFDLNFAHEKATARNISAGFGGRGGSGVLKFFDGEIPRNELAGIMANVDVMVVTPVSDGMNLCAKEFIAAQDARTDGKKGVLVLSTKAGAAERFGGNAVLVDPYNGRDIARGLLRATKLFDEMDQKDWKPKYAQLHDQVFAEDTAEHWATNFLTVLRNTPGHQKAAKAGVDKGAHKEGAASSHHKPGSSPKAKGGTAGT